MDKNNDNNTGRSGTREINDKHSQVTGVRLKKIRLNLSPLFPSLIDYYRDAVSRFSGTENPAATARREEKRNRWNLLWMPSPPIQNIKNTPSIDTHAHKSGIVENEWQTYGNFGTHWSRGTRATPAFGTRRGSLIAARSLSNSAVSRATPSGRGAVNTENTAAALADLAEASLPPKTDVRKLLERPPLLSLSVSSFLSPSLNLFFLFFSNPLILLCYDFKPHYLLGLRDTYKSPSFVPTHFRLSFRCFW